VPDRRPDDTELDHVLQATTHALLRLRAETAGQTLAMQALRRYAELDASGQTRFFRFLLRELGADRHAVASAISRYQDHPDEATLGDLAEATESQRLRFFRTLNIAPGGIATLLDMRAALLERRDSHSELMPVERDLAYLLTSWFNRGFLRLEQLRADSPETVLEKLIEYEAVHEIRDRADLERRLAPDRRMFAFFHPALPDEPIIFVEVALTAGMADSIQTLLDAPTPSALPPDADSAMFYSITNCQSGLRGISFGSFLIKRVTELLQKEIPALTTFATLSPIPGFASWLAEHDRETSTTTDTGNEAEMTERVAQYLLAGRSDGLPIDPVARFHLRNGASVDRINWRGDTSPKGLAESHGLLVNYRYSGHDLAANHASLIDDGIVMAAPRVIAAAGQQIDPSKVSASSVFD
jgi:malonyl-CoA decarboxylase